ncbi:MAG: SCP2 sterol-binding domain-containing protein [Deltaproteobacteria bacterium]|nr:SCP2 sterol-binding domain-containing protein [Deltaproteobacteria bacterium]
MTLEIPAGVTPHLFFGEILPAEHARLTGGNDQGPESVTEVELLGDGGGTWAFAVRGGKLMQTEPGELPADLWIRQDAADWRAFMDEITGAGSASAGRAGTAALVMTDVGTRQRLLALKGSVRFELKGLGGRDWNLTLGLRDASRDEPGATISMNVEDYRALLDGKLDPMQAFMQGKTRLSGDTNLAMQYGMALLPLFQPSRSGPR